MLQPLSVTRKVAGELVTVPHWFNRPEEDWECYEHFPTFLARVWDHLSLPALSEDQLQFAHRLQYGYDAYEAIALPQEERDRLFTRHREDIIRAYRSFGKSYITAAYAIWLVMRNPRDEKVLVISATAGKSKAFVSQVKGILETMQMVKWLLEGDREGGAPRRDEAEKFDVAGASLSQSQSIMAKSMTGQITGDRATTLIADDIEIPDNSKTETARANLIFRVRTDFGPIINTEFGKGDIIFLGTPQTEESIYNTLVIELGYRCMTIPIEFPAVEKLQAYVLKTEGHVSIDILAPYLRAKYERGDIAPGDPVNPVRFNRDSIIDLKAKGLSVFLLQYMLDTSLSDAERYPLKLHDLIVFSTNPVKAPRLVQWGRDSGRKNVVLEIPNLGFSGDHLLRPLFVDPEWVDYDQLMIYVDPAGRGKDETAWVIMAQLNGMVYILDIQGEAGEPETAMRRIARDVLKWRVRELKVEPNFGQGMWAIAFLPILAQEKAKARDKDLRTWACAVTETDWAKGQKEVRIIDTLEPALTTHRVVINESILVEDAKTADKNYSFMYQLTHITRERKSLAHDDRLDAVAGAVAYYMASMGADAASSAAEQKIAEQEALVEAFEASLEGTGTLFTGRYSNLDGIEREVWHKRFEWER